MADVLEAISKRSSTRGYTEEPLTEEELQTILNAGLQAPTATNRQELHFTVVKGKTDILTKLDAEKNRLRNITDAPTNFYYNAPVLILISAESAFGWSKLDAGIAVQTMALAAEELGLGSLIIGCINDALHGEQRAWFEQQLKFPENYDFCIALAVGHKAVTKEPHTYDEARQVTIL